MTYTSEQMALKSHIQAENAKSRKQMDENSGLGISMVTDDLDHWADYGITDIEGYDFYMASCGAYEAIADATSKSFARWALEQCTTKAELDAQVARYTGDQ